MKVALCSIFRDSTSYLEKYFKQVHALNDEMKYLGHKFHVVWVEGDSIDDTWDCLFNELGEDLQGRLVHHSHGGPKYGSVDLLARWQQTAPVCNKALENIDEDDNVVIYVESDLIWQVSTMIQMMNRLTRFSIQVDAVGGMIWLPGGFFYDVYAYHHDGIHFGHTPPYHPMLIDNLKFLNPIDSVGSCIVMRGNVARNCRFNLDTCLIGEDIKAKKYHLCLDQFANIYHP